ncbi:MAG: hypothetical protein AAGD86_08955, partial [Pseudomonadota bacterium]
MTRIFAALALLVAGSADAAFVANHGQYPPSVRFAAPAHPLAPWASDAALWLTLPARDGDPAVALRLSFPDALPSPRIAGAGAPGPRVFVYRSAQRDRWLGTCSSQ